MTTADDVKRDLAALADGQRAADRQWFFKTQPGGYGEGDVFIGVTLPEQRNVARRHRDLSLADIEALLASEVHEHRLTALLVLVDRFACADDDERQALARFYLDHLARVDNWDLVDASADRILGEHLAGRAGEPRAVLDMLSTSEVVWERRVAIVATFALIKRGETGETLRIAEILLHDRHDLIHKAVGWMLREVGKRASDAELRSFLDRHATDMPRTMLRYAIERLPEADRHRYMTR